MAGGLLVPSVKTSGDLRKALVQLHARVAKADTAYAAVGILEPNRTHRGSTATLGQIAAAQEFGAYKRSGATKSGGRVYSFAQTGRDFTGRFLKKGATAKKEVKLAANQLIPSRSFLRTPIQQGEDKIAKARLRAVTALLAGKINLRQALNIIGAEIQRLCVNSIVYRIPPPLAPGTLRAREKEHITGDTPLLATGQLRAGITFRAVIPRDGDKGPGRS